MLFLLFITQLLRLQDDFSDEFSLYFISLNCWLEEVDGGFNLFPTVSSPLTSKTLKIAVAGGTVGKGLKKTDLETGSFNPFPTGASP